MATQLDRGLPAAAVTDLSQHVIMAGPTTLPYLQRAAGEALIAAIRELGVKPRLVHALRTLPQQYAVSQWYLRKRCGIPLAALPGTSPHEHGVAIDVDDFDKWIKVLRQHNWQWRGEADRSHFNFHGPSDPDFGRYSVLAFQKLWSRNRPSDKLTEDGVLGPKTIARLESAPAGGFPNS